MRTVALTGFVVWCGVLTVIDLRSQRLPNALTVPGAAAIVTVGASIGELRPAVVGASILAGSYLLVHLCAPRAMGAGDVKLALGLGAATGLAGSSAWLVAAVLAPAGTALAGSILRLGPRAGSRSRITVPHGPSMCAATLIALVLTG